MKYLALLLLSLLPFGRLGEDLVSRDAYKGQSTYMNMYHAALLSDPDVQISFHAPLAIDKVYPAGELDSTSRAKLYPFKNELVVLKMSGQEIKDYLEASYGNWIATVTSDTSSIIIMKKMKDYKTKGYKLNFKQSPGDYDSAGGLIYTVDVTKPVGERVKIKRLANGQKFRLDYIYNVGMTSYRARGAGKMLKAAGIDPKNMEDRVVKRGPMCGELLNAFIDENGEISSKTVGNRKLVGSWKFIPAKKAQKALERDLKKIFPEQ